MTQIEKEAFFALYYGQKVLNTGVTGCIVVLNSSWNLKHPDFFLQLKSIKSITDEDAKMLGFSSAYDFMYYLSFGQQFLQEEADFLRSKGYLVPFRQYSTDQLIEQGIVKV